MLQNLQHIAKFQKLQLDNLVDFEKCCKTHIFLQNSVPIQPKTSKLLTICLQILPQIKRDIFFYTLGRRAARRASRARRGRRRRRRRSRRERRARSARLRRRPRPRPRRSPGACASVLGSLGQILKLLERAPSCGESKK